MLVSVEKYFYAEFSLINIEKIVNAYVPNLKKYCLTVVVRQILQYGIRNSLTLGPVLLVALAYLKKYNIRLTLG